MGDSNDVQALSKISSEVDDSQIKIYLSSQCIKAQAFLFDKLRKQTDTQKEIFKHIWSSNSKLEVEIKNAEDEIKSLMLAVSTVKSANIELKKELLLAKESKQATIERIRNGEKKYEALWLQCKSRYESLPHVQKLLNSTQKLQSLKEKVEILKTTSKNLTKEIDSKKKAIAKTDQARIIALSNYIINERPVAAKEIKEKNDVITKLRKEIEEITLNKSRKSVIVEIPEMTVQACNNKERSDDWPTLLNMNEDSIMMPKLELKNIDLDCLSAKLDQIKRTDSNTSPLKRTEETLQRVNVIKKPKFDNSDYFSTYFKDSFENESQINSDYSKKKLINILEDVKLNDKDTFNLISKVNPDKFNDVQEIKANEDGKTQQNSDERKVREIDNNPDSKIYKNIENEIEEVDMTSSYGNSLIIPPTQFLDLSQEKSKSQSLLSQGYTQQVEAVVHKSMDNATPEKQHIKEPDYKKKVSFDIPSKETDIQNVSDKINESTGSQLNISSTSDHSYHINMILKEHNLDLSPTFVYTKNNLQKPAANDLAVTSKFFNKTDVNVNSTKDCNIKIIEAQIEEIPDEEMKEDTIVVSSPKSGVGDRQVAGFLFSHGAGNIPDSLDVSLSTAGYDEHDLDYQCIDSSVLLSPKADTSMPIPTEAEEVTSQELPNFLSGLRKSGLSFFGKKALESKPDAATTSQSGFNFNFGSDDKKPRGGLFSMFR